MPQHPASYEILARDRAEELRRTAQISAWSRRRARREPVLRTARHATGWFLVDLGLRLASPRGRTRSA